jgi:UDP-N-acetylglucosamine--N-acetylmuramyl-(pentapeptide) pyrophosphoryl-undecaprenol N-acetylglucosamine transferase
LPDSDGPLPTSNNDQTGYHVVYVGSSGMEQEIVKRESNLPFRTLPTAALRGRGPLALLRGVFTLGKGTRVAMRLLHELQPTAILGTGGYVCVPLFLAARAARIPTLIYLPDVVPGLAVKLLVRLASQVACNVADSRRYLHRAGRGKHPLLVTGYPVRPDLFEQDRDACRAAFGLEPTLPVLVVYGGSRGARAINRAVQALLGDILEMAQVIHICGREGDETWLRETASGLSEQLQARYRLYPYLENVGKQTMLRALGAADLALCRSGASTLAELPAVGLPAILVPYPYVHQEENADYLVRHGAAVKVMDAEMLGSGSPQDGPLFIWLRRLLTTTHERQYMAQQCHRLARPDAAQRLADALCDLAMKE